MFISNIFELKEKNENRMKGKHLKILILENEPQDAELLVRKLEENGFDVGYDLVETMGDLMILASARNYDVILADYMLPGCTEIEVCRSLKESGDGTPVILVTESLGEEHAVECIKEGIADYVLKDSLDRLPAAVSRVLNEKALENASRQMEDALLEREESFRIQYKSFPLPTYTWQKSGEDYVLLDFNDAAAKLENGAIQGMLGTKASELFRGRPDILEDFSRCYAGKTSIEREAVSAADVRSNVKRRQAEFRGQPGQPSDRASEYRKDGQPGC